MHTYSIGTVIDSVSNELEEATDIMNEKRMTAQEGEYKSRDRSQWWVIERGEEGNFRIVCHGQEMRLPCTR